MQLLLENFTTICLAIGLGIIILSNKNFEKKTNTSFLIFVVIILGSVAASITDQWFSELSYPSIHRYIASATGYVLRPASIAILIHIRLSRKKTTYLLWVPVGVIAVLAYTSGFTHLMFWFNATNTFMRGPFSYIAHITSAAYAVILMVLIIQSHKYITSSEIFAVSFSVGICVLATVLETKLSGYQYLVNGAMAVSCALYYIILYVETYKLDPLTGLLNRRSLYMNVQRMKDKQCTVISVDLNCLKDINDTRGHNAGDEALKQLSEILVSEGGAAYCPYRTGGDEFVVIGKENDKASIDTYISDVRNALRKENIMASFGHAVYNRGENFDEVCNAADEKMYEDKKHYKHRTIVRDAD